MNYSLSATERDSLLALHKKTRDGKERDRIKAVVLANDGWQYKEIAQVLFLDEQTVARHVHDYHSIQKTANESGGSFLGKLTPEQALELDEHACSQIYQDTSSLCSYVKEKYAISFSISGMTRWLKSHGFSYKKPIGRPAKLNVSAQDLYLQNHAEFLKNKPANEPLYYLDAAHPTMGTKLAYGWMKKGQRTTVKTSASRSRCNLLAAVNTETGAIPYQEYETVNSDAMVGFLGHIKSLHADAPTIHIILDCGPYNMSEQTKSFADKNNIKLRFLPPYSPNLNLAERIWKWLYEHTRNNMYFASVADFKDKILDFFKTVVTNTTLEAIQIRFSEKFQYFSG